MNAKELSAQVSGMAARMNSFIELQPRSTKVIIDSFFSVSIRNNEIYLICKSQAAYDALKANGGYIKPSTEKVRVMIEPDD